MSLDTETYVEVGEGNQYFSTKLKSEYWDEANNDKRIKALKEATRLINNLNFKGHKYNESQELFFPRLIDDIFIEDTPKNIKIACLEIAYMLLDDTFDIELETQGLMDTGTSFASVRSDKSINMYNLHLKAGIPSAIAWQYLLPYLVDPKDIHFKKS